MKKSYLGAIRQLSHPTRKTEGMPMPPKAIAKALLFHATVIALSGLKLANAPLVKSAPGPPVIPMKIVAGTMPARAREKVRAKIGRRLLHLMAEAALLTRIRSTNVVPPLLVVKSPLRPLPASEVSLLQVKLTGLLALDT